MYILKYKSKSRFFKKWITKKYRSKASQMKSMRALRRKGYQVRLVY